MDRVRRQNQVARRGPAIASQAGWNAVPRDRTPRRVGETKPPAARHDSRAPQVTSAQDRTFRCVVLIVSMIGDSLRTLSMNSSRKGREDAQRRTISEKLSPLLYGMRLSRGCGAEKRVGPNKHFTGQPNAYSTNNLHHFSGPWSNAIYMDNTRDSQRDGRAREREEDEKSPRNVWQKVPYFSSHIVAPRKHLVFEARHVSRKWVRMSSLAL